MNKYKRQAKQDERDIKLLEDVISGKIKIGSWEPKKKTSQANRKGGATPNKEEEETMIGRYARFLRILLPGIMAKLSQIEDPREPNKVKHSLPLLILFGILMFLSHCTSRRSANKTLAQYNLLSMVEEFVPGVNDMPHADTLARLLCDIEVEEIDRYYEDMLKSFIKSNQFNEIQTGRFRVAVDGTQKFTRRYKWDDRALSRNAGEEGKERYYVYILESTLILDNGMVLPLLTEVLENNDPAKDGSESANALKDSVVSTDVRGDQGDKKSDVGIQQYKQDCETKAFHRLSKRIAKLLGKGCVSVVLDGIYATGPIISRCIEYGWEYMIVLKNECLKTVWEDFNGLRKLEKGNTLHVSWDQRQQEYHWSNDLEYMYGKNHKKLNLNLVTCTETWTDEHPRSGKKPKNMKTEYAWLSSKRVTEFNAFELCTIIARSRWKIENFFLTAKHQGYSYSHCYSYNWNAMKGFHYLMKFGIFINALISYSELLSEYVRIEGKRGFVQTIWKKITEGKWQTCEINEYIHERDTARCYKIKYPPLIKAA